MSDQVTSADGTTIAYDQEGDGPAVILVAAAMNLRGSNAELAKGLAAHGFTVVNYDRRGRGESTDEAPLAEFDLDRELEDIAALMDVVGGRAALFGSSSGCAVCLYAAASGLGVSHLALWEIPLPLGPYDGGAAMARLKELVAAGDHGGAVEFYMRDMPPQWLAGAKASPYWAGMQALAPSLGYDLAALDRTQTAPLAEQFGKLEVPARMMMGEQTLPIFPAAADALVDVMPNAQRVTLPGANHAWQTDAMVAELSRFFTGT